MLSSLLTSISILIQLFNQSVSSTMYYLDITLLVILFVLHRYYDEVMAKGWLRFGLLSVFPWVYFPLGWLNSGGASGVGLYYFFIISMVIIYLNTTRLGFISVLVLSSETWVLLFLERNGIITPFGSVETILKLETLMIHFPILSIIHLTIFYYIIKRSDQVAFAHYNNSILDPLTGIGNRRHFYEQVNRIKERSLIDHYLIIFIDVDGLKVINDVYGHDFGDRALQVIAQFIDLKISDDDIFARIGGDEFAIVTSSQENYIAKILKSVTRELSSERLTKLPFSISISYGVDKLKFNEDEILFGAADCKMYQQKQYG